MNDVTSTSAYPPNESESVACPYKEFNEDVITHLAPKPVDFFPDPIKYPPPRGVKDIVNGCGCLMTRWGAGGHGDSTVRLETIWEPLYDTQDLLDTGGHTYFFQNPDGRSRAYTNLPTAGSLTWPKRFHIWEIEFTFEDMTVPNKWLKTPGESPVVVLSIGEKEHFYVPFAMFHRVPSRINTFCAPLPSPLYLPPVQNFRIRLEVMPQLRSVEIVKTRCALNGYLHREIP